MAMEAPLSHRLDGAATEMSARLRQAGLKVTRVRIYTLAALELAEVPQSHDELAYALQQQVGHSIDRITVYRSLMALTRAGLLRREHSGDRIWRYRPSTRGDDHKSAHPHFTCKACGSTLCLPQSAVGLSGPARALSAQLGGLEVTLSGQCRSCRARTPKVADAH